METTKYEAVSTAPQAELAFQPLETGPTIASLGSSLLRPRISDSLRWYLPPTATYTISLLCVLIWISTGPIFPSTPSSRVLRTGGLHVNQFYSGLFLSAILTPAAVVIRQVSDSFAQIHPFSLAASTPIKSTDLDRLVDPGVLDLQYLWKYSKRTATLQSLLMLVGMLLVPLGTLTVTTGTYVPQTNGRAVVGMPTYDPDHQIMVLDIMDTFQENIDLNQFATTVANVVKGDIVTQNGILSSTPAILGPVASTNISFENGVQYQGVVAYTWEAGCETAESDIGFEWDGGLSANFTFPNGKKDNVAIYEPRMALWSNATQSAGAMFNMDGGSSSTVSIPYAGTLFFAVGIDQSEVASVPENKAGLSLVNSTCVSRIKCTPSLTWDIYSCIWNETSMQNCERTPGKNVTELDIEGLNYLTGQMTAVTWVLAHQAESVFDIDMLTAPFIYWPGANQTHQLRVPSLQNYRSLLGIVANSISIATTADFYGTAEVPTVGAPEREVYVVRVYMVAIVFIILLAVSGLGVAHLIMLWRKRLPYRKASFLTIASATRGTWWDRELSGTSAMPENRLRAWNGRSVMFGVDVNNPSYVGLAPTVREIEEDKRYS